MKIFLSLVLTLLQLSFSACDHKTKNMDGRVMSDEGNLITQPENPTALIGKDFFIDDQHSYIGFRIKYFGTSNVRGRFDRFRGTAFYDSASGFISVNLYIDANSINTGMEMRDSDLKQGEWLHTASYPVIRFQSAGILKRQEDFLMKGQLTIKDTTKDLAIQFKTPTAITKDWAGNDQVSFTGTMTIRRQDFGVQGEGSFNKIMENGFAQVEDSTFVELEIHARRADYSIRKLRKDPRLLDSLAFVTLETIRSTNLESGVKFLRANIPAGQKPRDGTLSDIASVLVSEQKYADGLEALKIYDNDYPGRTSVRNQMGVVYLLMGNKAAAEEVFRSVLLQDTLNTKAIEYLQLLRIMK